MSSCSRGSSQTRHASAGRIQASPAGPGRAAHHGTAATSAQGEASRHMTDQAWLRGGAGRRTGRMGPRAAAHVEVPDGLLQQDAGLRMQLVVVRATRLRRTPHAAVGGGKAAVPPAHPCTRLASARGTARASALPRASSRSSPSADNSKLLTAVTPTAGCHACESDALRAKASTRMPDPCGVAGRATPRSRRALTARAACRRPLSAPLTPSPARPTSELPSAGRRSRLWQHHALPQQKLHARAPVRCAQRSRHLPVSQPSAGGAVSVWLQQRAHRR